MESLPTVDSTDDELIDYARRHRARETTRHYYITLAGAITDDQPDTAEVDFTKEWITGKVTVRRTKQRLDADPRADKGY